MAKKSKIQRAVEKKIEDLLDLKGVVPPKEELQVLSIAVKYLAVSSKLDEGSWGEGLTGMENNKDDPANELDEE